jgi:prevent-host-death family protein
MGIENLQMDISVTEFKRRCSEIVRHVETSGEAVSITRHGRIVARIEPPSGPLSSQKEEPWKQLRALGGKLTVRPDARSLCTEAFEASR